MPDDEIETWINCFIPGKILEKPKSEPKTPPLPTPKSHVTLSLAFQNQPTNGDHENYVEKKKRSIRKKNSDPFSQPIFDYDGCVKVLLKEKEIEAGVNILFYKDPNVRIIINF